MYDGEDSSLAGYKTASLGDSVSDIRKDHGADCLTQKLKRHHYIQNNSNRMSNNTASHTRTLRSSATCCKS